MDLAVPFVGDRRRLTVAGMGSSSDSSPLVHMGIALASDSKTEGIPEGLKTMAGGILSILCLDICLLVWCVKTRVRLGSTTNTYQS